MVLPGNLAIGIVQASTYKEQNSNKQQQQTEGTFGFFDVDFDGQDELIYVAYGQGHHGCTAFQVFELDGTEREDEPFDWSVDEYTEFDRREKSITVHQYGGLSDGGNIVKFKRQPDTIQKPHYIFRRILAAVFSFLGLSEKGVFDSA